MGIEEKEIVKKRSTGKIVIFFALIVGMFGLIIGGFNLLQVFPPSNAAADTPAEVIVVNPEDSKAEFAKIVDASVAEVAEGGVLENRAPSIQGKTDLTTQSVNLVIPSEDVNVCVYVNSGTTCPESKPYVYILQSLLKDKTTTVLMTDENVYLVQNSVKDLAIVVNVSDSVISNVAYINKASDFFRESTGLYSQGQIANIVYNIDSELKNKILTYAESAQ